MLSKLLSYKGQGQKYDVVMHDVFAQTWGTHPEFKIGTR